MAAFAAGLVGVSAVAGAVFLIIRGYEEGWGCVLIVAAMSLFVIEELGGAG
ncbi:hypothetical protein GCM10007094_23210 [Pseudovibrio japonicus]|uniref:Uncharacterized protein n=1 Tax=Pseudovibrio japonicus TaxID=366534 RepID=A0ABQ3EEE9_9HYPH|nr:hypothetical protein [Pseudovibrio japonicus]GHB33732.1 hypothetical protein GCM10007094_23210 [Pseudovibrio japonicus]